MTYTKIYLGNSVLLIEPSELDKITDFDLSNMTEVQLQENKVKLEGQIKAVEIDLNRTDFRDTELVNYYRKTKGKYRVLLGYCDRYLNARENEDGRRLLL